MLNIIKGPGINYAIEETISDLIIVETQYSVLASFHNFGDIATATISGSLILILGYNRVFLHAAWLIGPALLIIILLKKKAIEKKRG